MALPDGSTAAPAKDASQRRAAAVEQAMLLP